MKGMALTAEIGRKRQQMENQLANYALKMQAMEDDRKNDAIRNEIAWARLAQANDFKERELLHEKEKTEIRGERWAQEQATRDAREERLQGVVDDKRQKGETMEEASYNLNLLPGQLQNEGYKKWTSQYYDQLRNRSAYDLSRLPAQLQKSKEAGLLREYKDARDAELKRLQSDEKAFAVDYARNITGTGNELELDLRPLEDPKSLPDAKTGGFEFFGGGKKIPGKKLIKALDPETNTIVDHPVSMAKLNKFKQRYQELQKRREQLGPDVERPDIGIYNIDPNKKTVRVIAPDGTHGSLPADAVSDYVNNRGYRLEE